VVGLATNRLLGVEGNLCKLNLKTGNRPLTRELHVRSSVWNSTTNNHPDALPYMRYVRYLLLGMAGICGFVSHGPTLIGLPDAERKRIPHESDRVDSQHHPTPRSTGTKWGRTGFLA